MFVTNHCAKVPSINGMYHEPGVGDVSSLGNPTHCGGCCLGVNMECNKRLVFKMLHNRPSTCHRGILSTCWWDG
jgi:hypothetical protein